jgi:hypothetical protein
MLNKIPSSFTERMMNNQKNSPFIVIWAPPDDGEYGHFHTLLSNAAKEPTLSKLKGIAEKYGIDGFEIGIQEFDLAYEGVDYIPCIKFSKESLINDYTTLKAISTDLAEALEYDDIINCSPLQMDPARRIIRDREYAAQNATCILDTRSQEQSFGK